jgi:succinate dehydrogenase flavin-adding protein (antitoxin of CptAB toxin-antitoxin module)
MTDHILEIFKMNINTKEYETIRNTPDIFLLNKIYNDKLNDIITYAINSIKINYEYELIFIYLKNIYEKKIKCAKSNSYDFILNIDDVEIFEKLMDKFKKILSKKYYTRLIYKIINKSRYIGENEYIIPLTNLDNLIKNNLKYLSKFSKMWRGSYEHLKPYLGWFQFTFSDDVNAIYLKIINNYMDNKKELHKFISYINKLININKSYFYDDLCLMDINNNTPITFLYFVLKAMILKMNNNMKNQENYFMRNEYIYEKSDDIYDKLIVTTARLLTLVYTFLKSDNGSICNIITSYKERITNDLKSNNIINDFIIKCINNKYYICSDYIYFIKRYICDNFYILSEQDKDIYYNFISDIITNKDNNIHIKYNFCNILLDKFKDRDIVDILMEYIATSDFFNIFYVFENHISYLHLNKIVKILIERKININHKNINNFIYKLISYTNNLLGNLEELLCETNRITFTIKRLINKITYYLLDNIIIINYLFNNKIIQDIFINTNVMLIKLYKLFNQKYFKITNILSFALGEIINYTLNITYIYVKNTNNETKNAYIDFVAELNLEQGDELLKATIIEYLTNNIYEDNEIDLPDEMLDPILCSRIRDPVIIPDVKYIMDKTSIITHLYNNKSNPYTRNPLTIEQLEEYNNLEENKKIIENFKSKFSKYF